MRPVGKKVWISPLDGKNPHALMQFGDGIKTGELEIGVVIETGVDQLGGKIDMPFDEGDFVWYPPMAKTPVPYQGDLVYVVSYDKIYMYEKQNNDE